MTLLVMMFCDFDRLRIPFRCVATDIVNGSGRSSSEGDLARAVRASMVIAPPSTPLSGTGGS